MVLTSMQWISLAAFPMSFLSLTMGSMCQQQLDKELKNEFGIAAKLKVFPFFLVVCITKVWVITDSMVAVSLVNPYLASLPLLAIFVMQMALHVKIGVKWKESIYSSMGNLSSMRRPEAKEEQCNRLYQMETVASILVYSCLIATIFAMQYCGLWRATRSVEKASPIIGSCMLVVYIVVSQCYLRINALSKTLFMDFQQHSATPKEKDPIELDTLCPQGNVISEMEVERGDDDSVKDELGNVVRTTQQTRPNPRTKQYSPKWLALLMVIAIMIQLGLTGFFGHRTGREQNLRSRKYNIARSIDFEDCQLLFT